MHNNLTHEEIIKLRDTRLNQDHLIPWVNKWLNISEVKRPSHIQHMLKTFANMKAIDQKPYYVDPLTDELHILDRNSLKRTTYTKSIRNEGWKQSKYYDLDK